MFEKVFNVVQKTLSCVDGIWYFVGALLIVFIIFTVSLIVKNKEVFKFISIDAILILSLLYVLSGFNVNGALALIISLTLLSSVFYSILKIVPPKEETKSINKFIKSLDDKIKRENLLEAEEYKSILTGEDEIFIKKMKSSNVIADKVKDVNLSHAELLTERLSCYELSESDEKKVKEINDVIVDATLNRTTVENLNEKLSTLVRMLAKYSA